MNTIQVDVDGYRFLIEKQEDVLYTVGHIASGHCMDVVIDPEYNDFVLNGVRYDEKCSVKLPMSNAATKLMVKAVLQTLYERQPSSVQFTNIKIVDNSTFDCDGVSMPLANHNFLLYGKTWYHRHFGAKCGDAVIAEILVEANQRLSQPVNMTFEDFCRFGGGDAQKLRRCWETGQTWHELFQKINKKIGCGYFKNMQRLNVYFKVPDLTGIKFEIPITRVQRWQLNKTVTDIPQTRRLKPHRRFAGGCGKQVIGRTLTGGSVNV